MRFSCQWKTRPGGRENTPRDIACNRKSVSTKLWIFLQKGKKVSITIWERSYTVVLRQTRQPGDKRETYEIIRTDPTDQVTQKAPSILLDYFIPPFENVWDMKQPKGTSRTERKPWYIVRIRHCWEASIRKYPRCWTKYLVKNPNYQKLASLEGK